MNRIGTLRGVLISDQLFATFHAGVLAGPCKNPGRS
jgi:hypothetical protein